MLFSNDFEHWVLQDNWVVLGHPEKEAECSELSEAAYPFYDGCVGGAFSFGLGEASPLESSSLSSGYLKIQFYFF